MEKYVFFFIYFFRIIFPSGDLDKLTQEGIITMLATSNLSHTNTGLKFKYVLHNKKVESVSKRGYLL